MFQQFMGNIQELYDDVGSFFNDLLTKENISDIVKATSSPSRSTSTPSTGGTGTSQSPMFDFEQDGFSDTFMREMEQEHNQRKAVRAVDFNTINDEWVKRLQGIAFKRPYSYEEALSDE